MSVPTFSLDSRLVRQGFIDIHCHVLHDVDDGPKTLEGAVTMCEVARAGGTVALISTPHANGRFTFDSGRASARREQLQAQVPSSFCIYPGWEVEASLETLPSAVQNPRFYSLNGSRYLLLELMPIGMPPHLDRVLERLLERGVVPVLAHPERNAHLQRHPEKVRSWVERGCLAQVTAGSLTGRMGRRTYDAARELLRGRAVHFVASDAHDPLHRSPRLSDAYEAVTGMLSCAIAGLLFTANPLAVLRDSPVRAWPAF